MSDTVTPMQVERRLIELGKELDDSQTELARAEHQYMNAKSVWEIDSARCRMAVRQRATDAGNKVTVGEVDDETILRCQDQLTAYYNSEAVVKAARANSQRIRTQIEIARSIGASVRTSMEAL